MRNYKVSVAMATYNGGRYIEQQIQSIITQLEIEDELVISDDGSCDNTIEIVQQIMQSDKRISLLSEPQKGILKNFENAISNCNGDIIFLSDQDDIWMNNKVEEVIRIFDNSNDCMVVLHEKVNLYEQGELIKEIPIYRKGVLRNLVFSAYWGCCMAFRKDFLKCYLPFPERAIAHDQLIGLLSEHNNGTVHIREPLIYHRLHSNNVTYKRGIGERIYFRIRLLIEYLNCLRGKKNECTYQNIGSH